MQAAVNGASASARLNGAAASTGTAERRELRLPMWAYVLCLVNILIALVASGGLTVQHISGIPLPGCGAGFTRAGAGNGTEIAAVTHASACATLEVHPMGSLGGMLKFIKSRGQADKIPILEAFWPVSFLGAAYFASALAGWIVIGVRGRKMPALIPWVARLGALVSCVYILVIVVSGKLCPYCIASHAGNLTFWIALEIGMMKARGTLSKGWILDRSLTPVVAAIAVFVMSSGVLYALETRRLDDMIKRDQAEAQRQQDELNKQLKAAAAQAAEQAKTEKPPWGPPDGFRGRWLLGPKVTTIRVVMLTDFQCPDCRMFEGQAMAALDKYKDKISLSIVHYPMCLDCNPSVSHTMHANACRAARAAEAAAIIAGSEAEGEGKERWPAANEAFWKFAKWLFEIKGDFDDATLKAKLPTMGFPDTEKFMKVMNGDATLKNVQNDAVWGEALGLFYTPMMFVNGVEVRGWLTNPMALTQMIDQVATLNPPPADARNDDPPLVGQKYFEDWKLSPRQTISMGNDAYVMKTPGAKVDVVVWGDVTEKGTKELDTELQKIVGKKPINYSFRHYPVCSACNPGVIDAQPQGCIAAQAMEAAGIIGGADAREKMKQLIFTKQGSVSKNMLLLGGDVIKLNRTKFEAEIDGGPAKVAVQNDVMAGKAFVTRFIPALFVDGKYVERWKREGDNVLDRIIDYAVTHPGEDAGKK
jgi:protein-disulfide isomerase